MVSHMEIMNLLQRKANADDYGGAYIGGAYIGGCCEYCEGSGVIGGFKGQRSLFKNLKGKKRKEAMEEYFLNNPEDRADYNAQMARRSARLAEYNPLAEYNRLKKNMKGSTKAQIQTAYRQQAPARAPKAYVRKGCNSAPDKLKAYCNWRTAFSDEFENEHGRRPMRHETSAAWKLAK